MLTKECSKCKIHKNINCFSNDKTKKDGKYSSCKECKSKQDKLYKENNKDKVKKTSNIYYEKNKDKIKEISQNWYFNNREHCLEIKKKWYIKNFNKVKHLREQYKLQDINKWKEYAKKYNRERYRNNLNYKIKTILNKRIRDYIKNKNTKTLEFIGCSIEFFIIWIEYQFDEKMNWDNMGSFWHFDHVIPCAYFTLDDKTEQLICYHWSNIRPCEKIENIIKKNKILPELIFKHQQKAFEFNSLFI